MVWNNSGHVWEILSPNDTSRRGGDGRGRQRIDNVGWLLSDVSLMPLCISQLDFSLSPHECITLFLSYWSRKLGKQMRLNLEKRCVLFLPAEVKLEAMNTHSKWGKWPLWVHLGQFLQLSDEKSERTKLPHNEWTPHIHFRGTSFSHYIAINSTGCGLYLVCSWSRPRDMLLLAHDSSLVFVLAPHHIRPKTNLFLSVNEISSSPSHGIRQRGMLAYVEDKLR